MGLVVFSTIFGLGHVEQGYDVAVATAILGAFWGAIYLDPTIDPRAHGRPRGLQPRAGREVPDARVTGG